MILNFLRELRRAPRSLLAVPSFTATVSLSLALGIGASGTALAAFRALILRPLSYPNPGGLVSISTSLGGIDQDGALEADAKLWRRSARSFSGIAFFSSERFTLTGDGEVDELEGASVSSNFLRVLSLAPVLGRDFAESDEKAVAEPVVMLGDRLWLDRFGRDPKILGRAIKLDGTSYRIIAIAPPELTLPSGATYWTVHREPTAVNKGMAFVNVVGRLKPRVPLDVARSELSVGLREQEAVRPAWYPPNLKGLRVIAIPLSDRLFGSARPVLLMLTAAVALLLLTACVNVASLLLGRFVARHHDFALRAALGATERDLLATAFAESCWLALIGGLAGTFLAGCGVAIFGRTAAASTAAVQQLEIDRSLICVLTGIAFAVAALLAIVPFLGMRRLGGLTRFADGAGRSTMSRSHQRLRRLFVTTQIAVTLPLIAAAAVMAASLANVSAVDLGFRYDHLLMVDLRLAPSRYPDGGAVQVFFRTLASRVQGFPGVRAVAFSGGMPLRGLTMLQQIPNESRAKPDVQVAITNVSETFPAAAGLQLVSGRQFSDWDFRRGDPTVLLSVSAAKALFPRGGAVGQRLAAPLTGQPVPPRVVGIVKDVPQLGIDKAAKPQIYVPIAQYGGWPSILVVRTSVDPQLLSTAIRRAVAELDPLQAVRSISTMDEVIDANLAPRRRNVAIVETFAGIALILSLVGLYGLLSYDVRLRATEFGVRIALGAQRSHVVAEVARRAIETIVPALLLGVFFAIATSRLLESFTYGLSGSEPRLLIAAVAMFLCTALLACMPAALRAVRTDPMRAIRGS